MDLKTGSRCWYVAGARFADGYSIVSVQLVTIIDCWDMPGGSRYYGIDLGKTIYTDADRLFAEREEAEVEAIRLQRLKIERARELLELHIHWLETLENPKGEEIKP